VPGVDDPGRAGVQVDAQELTGDELAGRRVLGQAVVGVAGLLAEAETLPAAVAQAADSRVASRDGLTWWPTASVIDTCRQSRSRV
jgi:hypothetical protein